MDVTLKNEHLRVRIAETGAEIKSITDNLSGIEYMWQADPAHWNGSAPVLFPIIGGLKDNTYYFDGRAYSMPAHGFVRRKQWELAGATDNSATFQTVSDDSTRAMYPFEFALTAQFALEGSSLSVTYEVTNSGTGPMYFSIGSHPAFNMPFAGGHIEHYYFHFSEPEKLERYFFKDGMHLNETAPVFDNTRQIFLTRKLFDRGPIILKQPASKCIYIKNSRNSRQIRVATDGIPYLALWAKPGGAPFVCIEPWFGVPDNVDTDCNFTTKEGIMSLVRGGVFKTTYRIDILDGAEP